MSAIILAGGKSSRMGKNKMLLPLGNGTVISNLVATLSESFHQPIIVSDHSKDYRHLPVRLTGDLRDCKVKSSLVGIYSGLKVSQHEYNLVVAGDMPFVSSGLVRYLCDKRTGFDVVIPRQDDGYLQPLCAVYNKSCMHYIEEMLDQDHFKVSDLFKYVSVHYIEVEELRSFDPELYTFFNINTPEEYSYAQKIMRQKELQKGEQDGHSDIICGG